MPQQFIRNDDCANKTHIIKPKQTASHMHREKAIKRKDNVVRNGGALCKAKKKKYQRSFLRLFARGWVRLSSIAIHEWYGKEGGGGDIRSECMNEMSPRSKQLQASLALIFFIQSWKLVKAHENTHSKFMVAWSLSLCLSLIFFFFYYYYLHYICSYIYMLYVCTMFVCDMHARI